MSLDKATLDKGGVRFKTGTYTGDGNATKAISGIGFRPIYIAVYPQLAGGTYEGYKTDRDGAKTFVDRSGSSNNLWEDDHIISLDNDGFTIGDGTGGAGNFLNVLARVYTFIALG